MAKSTAGIIISKIIGFIIFLILLAIANYFIPHFNNTVYASVVGFFNVSIILLLILLFIGIINDIFWNFYFPFNLIAPISSAFLAFYIIRFIYQFWNFLDSSYIHSAAIIPIRLIYLIVIILVLIFGYLKILIWHGKSRRRWEDEEEDYYRNKLERKKQKLERKMDRVNRKLKKEVEWDEVGDEFKMFFYNLGKSLNDLFDDKKNS